MGLSKITNASLVETAVHGRRNHIINGGFQCWQRNEDKENTGSSWAYWSVDRFKTNKGRFRKTTDTVDGRTVNVLRIDPSSGVYNGGRGLFTVIEDCHVYDKPTILSVWVKADAATTASLGTLYDYGNSANADNGDTINVTTSWQRFNITYSAQTFTQAAAQYIITGLQDGRTYYVAMAQLELGSVATDFEYRSYGEELALCQRYYQIILQTGSGSSYYQWQGQVFSAYNTTRAIGSYRFPVIMRAVPTGVNRSLNVNLYQNNSNRGPTTTIPYAYPSVSSIGFDFTPAVNLTSGSTIHVDIVGGEYHVDAEL